MLLRHEAFRKLCEARDRLGAVGEENPPTVREVAREVGLSPYHFIRQFEALFGMTPHQYRIEARLREAKRRLAAGDESVTDVCMEVGMSSLGSFSGLFARKVGTSPREFQERARTANPFPGCLSLMGQNRGDRNFGEAAEAGRTVEFAHANQAHQPDDE